MKKIAILTERLKTGFGVDLVVYEQASRLAKRHQVTVFVVEVDKNILAKAPFTIYPIRLPLAFNPFKQDLISLSKLKSSIQLLKGFDDYIVHTPTFNSWFPTLAKEGKLLLYYYGNSPSFGYQGLKQYRKQIFDWLENNLYFYFPQKIIAISQFLKNQLNPKHQSKAMVSLLGADHVDKIVHSLTNSEESRIKAKYFIEPKDLIITYIGRLDYRSNPYKNTRELIRIKQQLIPPKQKRIKILAIGYPQNQIEEEFFQKGVCVVPSADDKELVALLKASYLYFSPTKWEGFNLPFIEAQRLGVPVVGYKVGAHTEVVRDGITGKLVNTFKKAVETIQFLVNHEKERQNMSVAAEQFAKNFTWENNVKQLELCL